MTTHTRWKDTTWEEYWESLLTPRAIYRWSQYEHGVYFLKSICLVCGKNYWKGDPRTSCGTPQCVKGK